MRGPRACMRLGVQAREYVGDAIVIFQLHRGIGCVRSGPNASYGPRSPPILPTRVGGFLLGCAPGPNLFAQSWGFSTRNGLAKRNAGTAPSGAIPASRSCEVRSYEH